jgi:hypothetical protein
MANGFVPMDNPEAADPDTAMHRSVNGLSELAHILICATSRFRRENGGTSSQSMKMPLRLIAVIILIGCGITALAIHANAKTQDKNNNNSDKPITTVVRDKDKITTTTIYPNEARVVIVTAVYGMGGTKRYEVKSGKNFDIGPRDEVKKLAADEIRKRLLKNTGYAKVELLPLEGRRFVKKAEEIFHDYCSGKTDRKTASRRLMYLELSSDGVFFNGIVSDHRKKEARGKSGVRQNTPVSAASSTGEKKP